MALRPSSALVLPALLLLVALCRQAEARLLLQKTNSTEGDEGRRELVTLQPGQYLNGHNAARQRVGSPALAWNTNAAISAQNWANHLRSIGCAMQHGGGNGNGQNLAWSSGLLTPQQAVQLWVNEGALYHRSLFNPPAASGCSTGRWGDCGHYTQVVWRGTQGVGCGRAQCPNGNTIVVCDYYPAGNIVGQFPY